MGLPVREHRIFEPTRAAVLAWIARETKFRCNAEQPRDIPLERMRGPLSMRRLMPVVEEMLLDGTLEQTSSHTVRLAAPLG